MSNHNQVNDIDRGNAAHPQEKDFENGYHLDANHDPETALKKIQTSGSLSISPELFEKIYLSPQNKIAGDLRKTFANPTPLALAGFLLSLSPLSCALMGWRGAADGYATIGVYIGFGGILMLLGGLGEFILGNTFPFVVFGTFGSFWIAFALTNIPYIGASGNFSPNNPTQGAATPAFNSSWAFFLVFMGVLCLVYSICALRTNIVLFLILLLLVPAFGCLAGAYWHIAENPTSTMIMPLLKAGGALAFVICMLGWYIFSAIMLAALDFPFALPVGDLSHIIKGASERQKARDEYSA